MPITKASDYLPVFDTIFGSAFEDTIERSVLLPNLIPVETKPSLTVSWKVGMGGRNTARLDKGDSFNEADVSTNVKAPALLPVGRYAAFGGVDGQVLAAASISPAVGYGGSSNEFGNILFQEAKEAMVELADLIATQTYTGVGVAGGYSGIYGLDYISDATQTTYAGIDSSVPANASWTPAFAAGTTISKATLFSGATGETTLRSALMRPYIDKTGKRPTYVLCDGATFDGLLAMVSDKIAYNRVVDTVRTVGSRDSIDLARVGVQGISFDGVYFIEDRHAPADTLTAIHEDALFYRQQPSANSAAYFERNIGLSKLAKAVGTSTGMRADAASISAALHKSSRRLHPTINEHGTTGDFKMFQALLYIQLVCSDRRFVGQVGLVP